jgi:NitT/TauT family transport system substrate-binding protein
MSTTPSPFTLVRASPREHVTINRAAALSSPSPLVGEGRGGGSGGDGTQVPHGPTPTPDPSPQGGGEKRSFAVDIAARALGCVALIAVLTAVPTARADDLWRHGTLVPKGDAGFIYMAAEGGFAKAQGLDLKMQAFQNDTLMMKALIAGELDSYEGSPISPLIAGSKGADVRILGCTWPKLTYSLFSHDGIGAVADLKGRKVGISAPGSLPDLVARALLKQAGIAPTEVSFVAAGSDPERVRALMAKTIDAAISTSDFAARPELKLKTLAIAGDVLPQFVRQCIVSRGALIRAKRNQLTGFVAAEMGAYGFAYANQDAVVALTRRVANLQPSDPVAEASYREIVAQKAASPAIEIDLDKLRWLRDLLAEDGRMAATFDPATLTDPSIREAALARVK